MMIMVVDYWDRYIAANRSRYAIAEEWGQGDIQGGIILKMLV